MSDSAGRDLPPALESFGVEFLAAIDRARHQTEEGRGSAVGDWSERVFRHESRHRRRGWFERTSLTGVALAFLAVIAWLLEPVLSGSGSSVLAATPPPLVYHSDGAQSARAVLLRLATVAAKQPVPAAPPQDAYAYVKSAGWYLDIRVSGRTVTSWVVPTVTESWTRADGHGRVIRRRASSAGTRVTETNDGPILEDFTIPAGVGHAIPLLRLSPNPAVVARQLQAGQPPKRVQPVWPFLWLTNLNLQQPVPANVESTILRILAGRPGLINSGTVTDRTGRPGIAISLDSAYSGLRKRYTLIFNPHTAGLLGEEETLIGNPRHLDVRRGAILDYTVFLTSRYVHSAPTGP